MPEPQDGVPFAPASGTGRQSADNPDELFDLVDRHDHVIGQVRRGEAHANPALIHRSVQILVLTSDARILLQRRSAAKDLYPGYYCASASGHVISGDDYASTAARELTEELGIAPPLAYLGKALIRSAPETEITALYATIADGPYHFHPTETAGGAFLHLSEVMQGRNEGLLPMTPALLVALDELTRLVDQTEGGLAAFVARMADTGGFGV